MSNGYEYFLRFILTVAFGYGILSYVREKNTNQENRS